MLQFHVVTGKVKKKIFILWENKRYLVCEISYAVNHKQVKNIVCNKCREGMIALKESAGIILIIKIIL